MSLDFVDAVVKVCGIQMPSNFGSISQNAKVDECDNSSSQNDNTETIATQTMDWQDTSKQV